MKPSKVLYKFCCTFFGSIPEIKSFGIEDEEFTVYVNSNTLNNTDEVLLRRLKRAIRQHYDFNKSNLLQWTEPVFHRELIQGKNAQCGMVTAFAERVDMYGENNGQSLYFITCAHLAPEREMSVFFWNCSNGGCTDRNIDCCEKMVLGVNMYPFDALKENPFDAVIDITCGIVNRSAFTLCNTNICGPHNRPIEIVDSRNSIGASTGKTVLKWDMNGNQRRGKYSGVQYRIENAVPRRVDIIKCDEEEPFGISGQSGAMVFLLENEGEERDLLSPKFVYLGKWANNKFMCFRLQEGLECLEMTHNLKLRLCLNSQEPQR